MSDEKRFRNKKDIFEIIENPERFVPVSMDISD
jgi:hypothetical protein